MVSNSDSALFRILGVSLALASATFVGASFIIKKKGLLNSNALNNHKPGNGHAYLRNAMWWTGMMLIGELCNVAAYAFQPAIIVTPLGAISVVISAVMSDIFLKEKLNLSGKIGCAQCVLGATLLVVNSPPGSATDSLMSFWVKVWDWVFMSYLVVNILGLGYLMLYAAPKWGEKSPLVYIGICSVLGSFVVVVLQVVGSAVVYSVENPSDSQLQDWTFYLLVGFVCCCGVTQINYLNKALNIFSTAIVTPIYFVCFTTATLICSAVLFRDFSFTSPVQLISALVGFLVIVGGVALLFAYNTKLAAAAAAASSSSGVNSQSHLRKKTNDSDVDSAATPHSESDLGSPNTHAQLSFLPPGQQSPPGMMHQQPDSFTLNRLRNPVLAAGNTLKADSSAFSRTSLSLKFGSAGRGYQTYHGEDREPNLLQDAGPAGGWGKEVA
ncbi:hypothetical protein HK100_009714 [Physocladia obscura]|uniref:Magnesium transporter n=1 Tax=Physocladia obscura TaxID=109957 RepID=A0AAD5T3N3_9FUNG|nr:hypothetical protein HK100_009714 [Physocladia obscura]